MKPIEILLIEDNPADAKLTAEALREVTVPNSLTVMPDGVEAMEFLKKSGRYADAPLPDLILMDVHLPRLGGVDLLKKIQSESRLREIPIVVLTGSVDRDERADLENWPIRQHLTKPFDVDVYVRCLQSILDDFSSY
ncbi:MAG TPA: response regulator [Methanomicrobiales archaeon]|nr:response regulator [Methanomicrobiales archaeon]